MKKSDVGKNGQDDENRQKPIWQLTAVAKTEGNPNRNQTANENSKPDGRDAKKAQPNTEPKQQTKNDRHQN